MNELRALAERCGIEQSFVDALGVARETTPETRQALLAAMGIKADSEEAARDELRRLDREEWRQGLPPALVTTQSAALSVPVTLPAGIGVVAWRLTLESGKQSSGKVPFALLCLVEGRTLESEQYERRLLILDGQLPLGYHQLILRPGAAECACTLIVSPGTCWLPPDIDRGRRLWGASIQLYLLRSATNWGIGDFTDLRHFASMMLGNHANAIGLNPLHAMFLDNPEHASPYSPASRLLLNVLNIDVAGMARESECLEALSRIRSPEFQRNLAACRDAREVDYSGVAQLKVPLLKMIFESRRPTLGPRCVEFAAFRREAGATFERSCLFLALQTHFAAQSPALPDWRRWPAGFQCPQSAQVKQFAETHAEEVTFQAWLQFIADRQLREAARAAAPMVVGLYRDLAVGADPSGAETWSNQEAVVTGAQVGAPPDLYNPPGQDWGLPPFNPLQLKKEGYRSFIELLRANMRHAGGLRIDHVMALQHLYWIPRGLAPAQGAYVNYPMEDLIGVLALESHRNRCLVVGEDLGTVPSGFRERMTEAAILSYRVLFFEKDEAGFVPPDRYPRLSLAVAGSHDLPTLRSWWRGSDLILKAKLGLFPDPSLEIQAKEDRDHDRQEVLKAFSESGLSGKVKQGDQFADAAHNYLAASTSAIAMVQIDDITHEETPVNVPTTSTQHPNWRRRLSMSLEQLERDPGFLSLVQLLSRLRP